VSSARRRDQKRAEPPPVLFAEDLTPTDTWRARAAVFVEACEAALWTDAGARARAYLAGRGLQDETLRSWRVGFHDADRREPASNWGLDDGEDVWLPRGITMPWLTGAKVWQVKVRRATNGRDKYMSVRGGHPLLYGADTLAPGGPAVMCEGEFDTQLLWQYVGDRTATVSLGSASRRPTRIAALLLAQADPLLAAYDSDDEGERGAERLRQLAPRITRIRPSVGKDIGEFVAAGGRPRAWITFELAKLKAGYR
jgi:Toprim-like